MLKAAGLQILLILVLAGKVFSSPIYVYKESDGSTRFSSRVPPAGVDYKIFTATKSTFSTYRVSDLNNVGSFSSSHFKLFKDSYNEIIKAVATRNKIDPHLLKAVIHVESAFNSRAVSPAGARGLMQLMPATARDLGVSNSFKPEQNIEGGARHLARLIVKYNNNLRFALAAYNAGEEPVDRYNGIPPYTETQNYVRRVLDLKERYKKAIYG
jgi:soluble lytic murein transglycosylase-like protein